jgi:hypothetical protein
MQLLWYATREREQRADELLAFLGSGTGDMTCTDFPAA